MASILHSKYLLNKITSIIRRFWWTGGYNEQQVKGICWRSWNDICKPISRGGLGIRDLFKINESLLISSAWRLLNNSNDLISKIIKEKYFPSTSFWKATKKHC